MSTANRDHPSSLIGPITSASRKSRGEPRLRLPAKPYTNLEDPFILGLMAHLTDFRGGGSFGQYEVGIFPSNACRWHGQTGLFRRRFFVFFFFQASQPVSFRFDLEWEHILRG